MRWKIWGGEVIEYPNPSPARPEKQEKNHTNISGWFAGYTAITQNPTPDSIYYFFRTEECMEIVAPYHPVILAGAMIQEFARPAPAAPAWNPLLSGTTSPVHNGQKLDAGEPDGTAYARQIETDIYGAVIH